MSTIQVALEGGGDCQAFHEPSGTSLRTSKSPAFGGSGRSVSSTDLLAIALGTCVATDLEPVAVRHSIDLGAIRLRVDKRFGENPKRIESLTVFVHLPADVDDTLLLKLERAAATCLVQRSLSPDLRCVIEFSRGEDPT